MADYLDAHTIRRLAAELGLRPSKQRGQNFVIDANTVRRIVAAAGITPGQQVLEIGPGLGSLTAGLLAAGARVTAVEIEPSLARRLPQTMADLGYEGNLQVIEADALTLGNEGSQTGQVAAQSGSAMDAATARSMTGSVPLRDSAMDAATEPVLREVTGSVPNSVILRGAERSRRIHPETTNSEPAIQPTGRSVADEPLVPVHLVANLPYNVAVPVLLHCLAIYPSLEAGLVMVQLEVAERLAAAPGSKIYGVPSAKLAWYAQASPAGRVPPSVFWPMPNVDSGLVQLVRREPPPTTASREQVFQVIDTAFAQRRKMLRSALAARWPADQVRQALITTGIDGQARGETLGIEDFARLVAALAR